MRLRQAAPGTAPPASTGPPGSSRCGTSRHRPPERLPLAVGLVLSALIHLLVLVVWSHHLGSDPVPAARRPASVAGAAASTGMRVVTIAPVTERAPPVERSVEYLETEPRPPEPSRPNPSRPEPPGPEPRTGEETWDAAPGAASAADRLGPRLGDRRLWAVPDEFPAPGESGAGQVRMRISARVEQVGDSMILARRAARRMLDWTRTDDEGRRWGIAPDGKLHLGGLLGGRKPTIMVAGKAEAAERFREWSTIRGQADLVQARELFNERVTAIRERSERKRARKDGGSR